MLTVLIVDDNASYRGSFRDLLRQHLPDVVVVEAADGKEALEQIRRTDPDLVRAVGFFRKSGPPV